MIVVMDLTWKNLKPPLCKEIRKTIKQLGFTCMTPVQAQCIQLFRQRKDIAAEAVTGSGKTLAFVIPMLEILLAKQEPLKKHEVGALIITPTRELAIQIEEVITQVTAALPQFTHMLMIGGKSPTQDLHTFQEYGAHIIVGTPGRLVDLLKRKQTGAMSLSAAVRSLEMLVLDEADRLLEMGFEASINDILHCLPKLRRTGLFSATQTDELLSLIRAGLRNPVRITVKEKNTCFTDIERRTPSSLQNHYMICQSDEKFSQLIYFLRGHKQEKLMLFFSTCAGVDYFGTALTSFLRGTEILCIHRKKDNRNKLFAKFRKISRGLLICTDVMARGVDIPDVTWVIQYDPPSSASAFVHRCGRTARIGNIGNALVFLLPSEDAYIKFIALNQKVPLLEYSSPANVADQLPKLRKLASEDRALFEKGKRAFVSFIQAYIKHECRLIFRLKDLDMSKLANGYGLLEMPKMPELKGRSFPDFKRVDTTHIKFKDKAREKLRQTKLKTIKEELEEKMKQKSSKSKHLEKKHQTKKEIRLARKRKQLEIEYNDSELSELQQEARLVKKFKSGKISSEQFEDEFLK